MMLIGNHLVGKQKQRHLLFSSNFFFLSAEENPHGKPATLGSSCTLLQKSNVKLQLDIKSKEGMM